MRTRLRRVMGVNGDLLGTGGEKPFSCNNMVDIKILAQSVTDGWVDNGDHTYTAINADGWINNLVVGFGAIQNNPKCSRITVLEVSAGSVSSVFDGTTTPPQYTEVGEYEYIDELWGDFVNMYIKGEGFTGTIRVEQISEKPIEA